MQNGQLITIENITIKTDSEGRFCLNDLHKAAGGNDKHAPAQWMRYETFKSLLGELLTVGNSTVTPVATKMGRYGGGTYVVKELVYAYAMWISPQFHLKVIRAYDTLATQGVAIHEDVALDVLMMQAKEIEKDVYCWRMW